jgi:HAE1 family hydrophobic/amphiphilic exporter-1
VSLTSFAVHRPVTTVATTIAVVLLGSVSVTKMPVSLLPDVELPVLTIRTTYPGAAATEVSRFVAEPIERSVAAVPGLTELRSVSRNGQVTTTMRFTWGTDMGMTVLNIREKLDNLGRSLPEGAQRPTLLTSDPGERPIAVIAIKASDSARSIGPGTTAQLTTLARMGEEVHSRRLEQLPGVAAVAVVGSPQDEIRVDVDPERLRALGITGDQVASAITSANIGSSGGTIRRGQFRYAVRALTELRSPDEMMNTPVGDARRGIKIRDIGTVTVSSAEPLTVTRLGGRPAIGLVVYKDAGANTVSVTEQIHRTLDQLRGEYPTIAITLVAAQAEFVTDALSNLWQEVWLGALLSILIPLVFLRDIRSSLAIALMLPLSVLVALVLLQGLDVTINVLSLGGLALGCGLLIDNAIVVAEAAGRRRQETGESRAEATIKATEEVSGPLIAGTLTTVLVFGPIVFVKGLAAVLFRDLSWSVVMSVGGSLLLALTLMPVMIVGRRRRAAITQQPAAPRPPSALAASLDRFGTRTADLYERGMIWALDHPKSVLLSALVIGAITVKVVMITPREILPRVDEGVVVGSLKLPEGTAIAETMRQTARIEAAAKELGADRTYVRVGIASDEELLSGADPGSSATAQLLIPAPDGTSAERIAAGIRARVPDLANGHLSLDVAGQSEFGTLVGREGRLVKVEVSARTLEESQRASELVRAKVAKIPSLSDVQNQFATTQPIIEIEYERERIAQRGIRLDAVTAAMSGALGGIAASELRETDRRTPITVRYSGTSHQDLNAALTSVVNGIPISELVRVTERRAPIEVVRVDQRPVTVVGGQIERGGTARATEEVTDAMQTLSLGTGVTWKVTGADIEQRRTTEQLTFVAILSAALMFLVLAGEFASFTLPVVVMLTVPFAAVGSLLFLWITGQSINAVSLIGIVVMIGMADNEAVVKLDAIRRFRDMGHSIRESVLRGGRQRIRAIAMTSLTTVTGVLPLMFGIGGGGALYQPLAASVIGGAVTSILVTFFLLPVAYAVLEGGGRREEGGVTPSGHPERSEGSAFRLPRADSHGAAVHSSLLPPPSSLDSLQ